MKRSIVALVMLAALAFASVSWAQKSKVIGTVHDVGGNGCGSCHAPHNGSAANVNGGTDQSTGSILLWDRGFSATQFGNYSSPTMNNPAEDISGTPIYNTEPRMSSTLCMSCHDGVTTSAVIAASDAGAIGNPTNSFGLTNDHPVNMSHDPTKDTSLAAVTAVTSAGLKLFGAGNTVQCGTCHDVHNNTNGPFLRIANTGSAMCTTCHN
ncbi:MAG: cytochrome c3 family protein [Terriglobales bacterium]